MVFPLILSSLSGQLGRLSLKFQTGLSGRFRQGFYPTVVEVAPPVKDNPMNPLG
jgi:hypothetical protein